MKVLMYLNDTGGLKTYTSFLVRALKENHQEVEISSGDKKNFEVLHIQFEYSLFHPFGLGVLPLIINNRLKGRKVILTMHTILKKNQIYARNNIFKLIKKIVLPLSNFLLGVFCNKIIVHRKMLKQILVQESFLNSSKIEVIPHGVY